MAVERASAKDLGADAYLQGACRGVTNTVEQSLLAAEGSENFERNGRCLGRVAMPLRSFRAAASGKSCRLPAARFDGPARCAAVVDGLPWPSRAARRRSRAQEDSKME